MSGSLCCQPGPGSLSGQAEQPWGSGLGPLRGPGVPSDVEAAGSLHGGGPSCRARGQSWAGSLTGSGPLELSMLEGQWRQAGRPRPAERGAHRWPLPTPAELPASAGPLSCHHWVQLDLGGPAEGHMQWGPGHPERHPQGAEDHFVIGHPGHLGLRLSPRRPQAASGQTSVPGASDRPRDHSVGLCL